jgi:phosphoadenosine phosphosulfate reductase
MGQPALKAAPEPYLLDLDGANEDLADASAAEIVRWAARAFGGRLAVSSSFGAQSAVMLHLVSQNAPRTPVIFIDTGYLFEETYRFAAELTERLDLDVRVYAPRLTAAYQEAVHGKLWEQGEEGIRRYLQLNKVEPMKRALGDIDPIAWLAGLRADQTEHRGSLRVVDEQNGRIKVHPILDWSQQDVDAYMARHDLPYHPLFDQGYRSIGDWHSTLPTLPDQDPRDGRILGKKRECGIHLTDEQNKSLTSSRL